MKVKVFVFLGLTAGLLMISGSVLAHHSNAPSDKDRLVTLTGTVSNFAFRNPHVSVSFDVTDGQGNVVTWFAAGTSPLKPRKGCRLDQQDVYHGRTDSCSRPPESRRQATAIVHQVISM